MISSKHRDKSRLRNSSCEFPPDSNGIGTIVAIVQNKRGRSYPRK